MQRKLVSLFIGLLLSCALAQGQQITVQTDDGKQTTLTRADIEAFPHVQVSSHNQETPQRNSTSSTFPRSLFLAEIGISSL